MRKLLILIILLMVLAPIVSAEIQHLGYFRVNDCITLKQICSNCSYVNITSVLFPNSTQILSEQTMTKSGTDYSYNFCNTSVMGQYIVNGKGDLNGVPTVWAYDFQVTGNGKEPPTAVVISFFSLIFIITFFYFAYSVINLLNHAFTINYDAIDTIISVGVYFVLLVIFYLENAYLGNPVIRDWLKTFIDIGFYTQILIPIMTFAFCLIVGQYQKKKLMNERGE